MEAVQSITEMALLRADFYRGKTPEQLRSMMKKWTAQGVDAKEITFWETRSSQFRVIVCQVAGLPFTSSATAWANLSEDKRQAIRVALRELKTVIAEGMDWRRVEVQTRRGVV